MAQSQGCAYQQRSRISRQTDGHKKTLSSLREDEAFFSIDEYGPFAIKRKGGTKRVGPGEDYVIPQHQKSKGWLIVTAALELSRNRISHFYSLKKNTEEMIRMADHLRAEYATCRRIYMSWDAASWHISKKLSAHLDQVNERAKLDGCPIVKTAPLPAGAQFLNVIESVFSGLAKAIIHNSDYPSVAAAKTAIDRYFRGTGTSSFSITRNVPGERFGGWSVSRASSVRRITARIRITDDNFPSGEMRDTPLAIFGESIYRRPMITSATRQDGRRSVIDPLPSLASLVGQPHRKDTSLRSLGTPVAACSDTR